MAVINRKKDLENNSGKIARCWNLLRKLFFAILILGFLWIMFKPKIYKKMGWELQTQSTFNETYVEEDLNTFTPPPEEQQNNIFNKKLTPEEIEAAEKELLK